MGIGGGHEHVGAGEYCGSIVGTFRACSVHAAAGSRGDVGRIGRAGPAAPTRASG